jgi:hypothetical protein
MIHARDDFVPLFAAPPAQPVAKLAEAWRSARAVDGTKHFECMGMVQIGDAMRAALESAFTREAA